MIKTVTFLTTAVLIAIHGRINVNHGAGVYLAVAIGSLCLLAGVLSIPWVKNRCLILSDRPRAQVARLLAVLFINIILSHAIYHLAYPEFTLRARLAIDILTFIAAGSFLSFLIRIRQRVARSAV